MRYDQSHPDYEAIKAVEDNAGGIADGTFAVLHQRDMVELFMFTGSSDDPSPHADKDWWSVTTSRVADDADGVYNSSYTGSKPLWDVFDTDRNTVYYDDCAEAHRAFCDAVMAHQIDGV